MNTSAKTLKRFTVLAWFHDYFGETVHAKHRPFVY